MKTQRYLEMKRTIELKKTLVKWIFIACFTLLSYGMFGQYKWQKTLGSNGNTQVVNSVKTKDGGLVLLCTSIGNGVDITQSGFGSFDYWVVKLDSNMNKVWDKVYGGIEEEGDAVSFYGPNRGSIILTKDNGFLIGGSTMSSNTGSKSDTSYGSEDVWILKLDNNGNKVWDKSYGGRKEENSSCIVETESGYLIGCTSASDSSGNKLSHHIPTNSIFTSLDYWIIKTNKQGNIIWEKSYGGSGYDILMSIIKVHNNKYILCGYSDSDSSYDVSKKTKGLDDYWVLCIDSNGNKLWNNRYGGNSSDALNFAEFINNKIHLIGASTSSNLNSPNPNFGAYDVWITTIDTNGNEIWNNSYGSSINDFGICISSNHGNLYLGANSNSNQSIIKTESSRGSDDYWILKLDTNGNKIWDKTIGGNDQDNFVHFQFLESGDFILLGNSRSNVSGDRKIKRKGQEDIFIINFSEPKRAIRCLIFSDFNANCIYNKPSEYNIPNFLIHNKTENTYAITNDSTYTIYLYDSTKANLKIINLDSNLYVACGKDSIIVDMTGKTDTSGIDFPIRSTKTGNCTNITSYSSSLLRPSMWATYQLNYQNNAFDTVYNGYIEIELDTTKIDSIQSPHSYTLTGNILRINIGNLRPFAHSSISYSIKLKTNVVIGSSHCHRAKVFPVCNLYPSTAYDSSEIQPMMRCLPNDTVELTLINIGSKNQKDWGLIKSYEDVIIFAADTFKLNVGSSQVFKYKLDTNKVFTAEIFNNNFHPIFPVLIRQDDLCANKQAIISNNPALNFSRHDEAKEYEEACDIIRGSYDPNIKSVQPIGMFTEHYTATGIELKYRIDFQNTGSDTAFRVVLIDTLSSLLDISTFVSGVSSHSYSVEFGQNRALKFIFDPIALIDSGTNEPASHGFVTFKIKHIAGITPKSKIENKADIYFDYNTPVRTNTVFNTIFDTIQIYVPKGNNSIAENEKTAIMVFPNPTTDKFIVQVDEPTQDLAINIYDMNGRYIKSVLSKNNKTIEVSAEGMTKGLYHIHVLSKDKFIAVKKLQVQ